MNTPSGIQISRVKKRAKHLSADLKIFLYILKYIKMRIMSYNAKNTITINIFYIQNITIE